MNLPNPVRVVPVRLFVAALALLSIPALAQTVVAKPAPTPAATTMPEPTATPAPTVTVAPAETAAPATPPAVTVTPAATVTAAPTATPAVAPAADNQMAKMQSSMTENVAKNDAADAAMKTHMDAMKDGAKSDMEMKHAIIAQLQVMSDQIQQLNDKVAALSTPPEPPAKPAAKAKAAAKPAVRAPIKPVY